MSSLIRFGVSIENDLLESFDQLVAQRGYATRSEALRDLIRDALVQSRVTASAEKADVLGSLTLVYDHHANELTDQMADIQHRRHGMVVSVLHVHVSRDDCMEVIVLRGKARDVREMADSLISLKGVKHGKLFITVPGQQIAAPHSTHNHSHPHPHHHDSPRRAGRNKK